MLYLIAIVVFATIFVILYKPINAPANWKPIVYNVITTGVPLIILSVSRVALYLINKHSRLLTWQYLVWLFGEVLLLIFITTTLSLLINPTSIYLPVLKRTAIDVLSVMFIPSVFALLFYIIHDQKREIARLSGILSKLKTATTKQTTPTTINFYDRGGKLAFSTRIANIIYIESADNYCNIHYFAEEKENTFILHNSMKYFEDNFVSSDLIRCHRGYIVNIANVRLLRKEGDKILLELTQGATIPVSRSYKERVVNTFTAIDNSANTEELSPTLPET
ncbi:MAG: LytTR family transcriptional regulator [Bacteroidales bacterium]|nr:LytTR family transcriptional regulator [Bacteroidales bacterium]